MGKLSDAIKRDIHIIDIAPTFGLTPKPLSGATYTLREHDSVRINTEDNIYFRHSSGTGGSVIDFVIEFGGVDARSAIQTLRRMLPNTQPHSRAAPPEPAAPKAVGKEFELNPKSHKMYRRAFAYLAQRRGIDPQIIKDAMMRGELYEDQRGNVCFVGKDYDGQIKYGFARTTLTDGDFRGDMKGSDKQVGFSLNLAQPWDDPPTKLFVSESAIDSMSLATMLHLHERPVGAYGYLSLSCVSPKALEYHIGRNPQIDTIYLCQDNDAAGDKSRAECREALARRGYEGQVIDKRPFGKDFNDDLMQLRQELQMQQQRGEHHEINQLDLFTPAHN